MRIRVEGPRSAKPPLVLIHGAGGSATVWLDVFRHFERNRRVVAPDLPGHGQSGAWPGVADDRRVDQFAEAIGTACAHLQIARAVLVGHSMGGVVALAAAAAYPDKVAGIVLVNSAPGLRASTELIATLIKRREQQAQLFAELAWSPASSKELVERWSRTVCSADPDTVIADFRATGAWHARPVSSPALFISGQDDLLCSPAFVQKRAEQMGARCQIIPDAGHFVHLEKPTETIAAIEEFLPFV